MSNEPRQLLDDAVARNCGVVLSFPSAGMLRHFKSRFLGDCDEGVWVESDHQQSALADALIASAQPAGCSFKSAHNKVVFASPVLRRQDDYPISREVAVEAVLLRRPEVIKSVQRRNSYRARVPADFEMTVRLWRIGREVCFKDRPPANLEVPCKLLDLSIGGVGLLLETRNGKSIPIHSADRLRIEFTHDSQPLVLEARLCFPQSKPQDETIRAGIAFVNLQDDLEGRRILSILTRITGELQRIELRKFRMGIA